MVPARPVLLLLSIVFLAAPAGAQEADPVPAAPEPPADLTRPVPPLVPWSAAGAFSSRDLVPAAWAAAAVGGATSLGITVWGLGSALADLSSPSGPPAALTAGTLAWGTVLLAAAGLALDYALTAPEPGPEPRRPDGSSRNWQGPRTERGAGFLRPLAF